MTTQKKLKARARARAARTGESYTTARRHVVAAAGPPDLAAAAAAAPSDHNPALNAPGYRLLGGRHPETATLANVLANAGVTDPFTNQPVSEADVLGIGGGLGAGYILWQFAEHDRRVVTLGFSHRWQYPAQWYAAACARLGQPVEVHETGGSRAAAGHLAAALEAGRPAIAFVSAADLPYWHLPAEESGWWGSTLVVYGTDGDRFLVDDRNRAPLGVTPTALAGARGRIGSFRNRLLVLDPVQPSEQEWATALREGLHAQVEHLASRSDSFGLPAVTKWARLLTHPSHPKAWPVVFADGHGLLDALVSTYASVVSRGFGAGGCTMLGGNLRDLYAGLLETAGAPLALPLEAAAQAYREAGDAWESLATLLRDVPSVAAVVDAEQDRWQAVSRGDAGAAAAAAAAKRSADARTADTGLDASARAELFAAMADSLRAAHEAERAALDELAGVIGA